MWIKKKKEKELTQESYGAWINNSGFCCRSFFPIESEFSRKLANSFDTQKYAYLLNQFFKIQENDSEEIIINSSNIKHNKNRQQPKNKSMFVVKYPTSLNNSID